MCLTQPLWLTGETWSCIVTFRPFTRLLCPPPSDPVLLDVVQGVHIMVVKARVHHAEGSEVRADARPSRMVREQLGEAINNRLLLFCQTENDDTLPDLYHYWGGRCRGVSALWIIQQYVDVACAAQDIPYFEVTPTQVMALENFRFA
jgi:hypothetical protein